MNASLPSFLTSLPFLHGHRYARSPVEKLSNATHITTTSALREREREREREDES